MTIGLKALAVGILFAVAAAAHAQTRTQSLSEAQAADLEKRFEQALLSADAQATTELIGDGATIVYASARAKRDVSGWYSTTEVWPKAEFVGRQTVPLTRAFVGHIPLFSSIDADSRKVAMSDDGFVATFRGAELILREISCMSMCFGSGPAPGIEVTVVWLHTPEGPRVTFLRTSLVDTDISKAPDASWQGRPIARAQSTQW